MSLLTTLLASSGGSGGGSVPGVILSPVIAASTTALTVTYANAASGIGATLTNAGTQAAFVLDGITLSASQRVLIKNQASALQNGVYLVTSVGSVSTNWVLTRTTDFDEPSEMPQGVEVSVATGSTQSASIWVQTAVVSAVGTSSITFAQTSASASGVTSLTGTANQIAASASTGAVTLSLPAAVTMPGTLTLNADPASALQAVTKQYADAISAGIDFKQACYAATTAALTASYVNGVAGVGATLTNAGTQAAFAVDGQTVAVNARVLIKNQASTLQNGIYTVTTAGTGATNWVLTRSTDYNLITSIFPGTLVPVDNGSVNAATSWLQTATVTAIGTDAITFTQFTYGAFAVLQNGAPIYAADSVGSDSYAVTLAPAPSAYTTGMVVNFKAGTANTGAATLNVNSLGAITIKKNGNATLADNDIIVGQIVTVIYDGTNFQMQSQVANSAAGSVTSVATGLGLSGGPITISGTLTADLTVQTERAYCVVAQTTDVNLTGTYSNGSSGVGATFTNSSTKVALTIDGVLQVVGNRVLIWQQDPTINGIYTVTTVGSGSVNWVLTRATDFDGAATGGIARGVTVWIARGTVNAGALFMQTDAGPWTIGTTAIDFTPWWPGVGSGVSTSVLTNVAGTPTWKGPFPFGSTITATGNTTIAKGGVYIAGSGASTVTLPASPSPGDCYFISGGYSGGTTKWVIAVSGSQQIVQGPLSCTVGSGTVTASHKYDSVWLMYIGSNIFNIIFSSSAGLVFA